MIWPNATDYNAAVQNPQLCFRDADLRQGQAVGDLFGLPRPHSGNFADVYQIQGSDGQSWAVKCFTRPVAGLRPRYQAITEHLRQTQRAFMVDFCYLDEGIRIHDRWYPLVKMRWVEGLRLNEFIREQLNKPVLLERLGQLWIRLTQELRDADMAHGDLQHGNVLLVPGSKSTSLSLKLIDYDGMFVPELADRPSGEVGHPNYQHPQRLREGGYDREIDRFAHLLIYTTLRCLRVGGLDLWQRYDTLENLLFREEDFRQPGKSRLLRELWDMKDRDSRYLVGHLLLASQGPLLVVPSLDELVDDSGIRPLSDSEERQINALLESSVVKPQASRGCQPPEAKNQGAVAPRSPRTQQAADAPRSPTPATAVLAAAPTVETAALSDTQPIALQAAPSPRRRTFAEIERDAQPAAPATPQALPFDAATLVDPLVSILSRPIWLAALGLLALVSFLIVNVLVWSSVKQPAVPATSTPRPALPDDGKVVLKEDSKEPKQPKQPKPRPVLEPPKNITETRPLPPNIKEEPAATVRAEKPPVRLKRQKAPESLTLAAGKDGELLIFLDRHGYLGKVEMLLEGLPAGATAEPVVTTLSFAKVKLETKEDTEPGNYSLKLLVRVDEQTLDERAIRFTVRRPLGLQETVHFRAVDRMELTGTLYHGWKRKKGMTVLMLHDLGRDRGSPGWKRLAETLQAEGHTVLTFDFRGHGDSKKVTKGFWTFPVNKYLPLHEPVKPAEQQPHTLEAASLPGEYSPWLIHDIAAARTFLDLQHDDPDGPVNTFNMVLLGAGQASALGSLWLATEGVRGNAADVDGKIVLKPPEKLSVLQAVWIGMEEKLLGRAFAVRKWMALSHRAPVTPQTYIFGAEDAETARVLDVPPSECWIVAKARLSGQTLLDRDEAAAELIQRYLVKTLQGLPPQPYARRGIRNLISYWAFPVDTQLNQREGRVQVQLITAKRRGEDGLQYVPLERFGVAIKGMVERSPITDWLQR
jgi:pimeloyl-ACP methyl ester carboxylesterase